MPEPASAGRAGNRQISRFVATFAVLSLLFSVLPLLTQRGGSESLLPVLDRGTSFSSYCVFLLLFVFFLLPGAFRRDEGRGLIPWAPLAAFILLFASIPGITSAYISGVARPQALFMGGLIACTGAVVVLFRAVLGRFAIILSFGLGCLLLFIVPGIEALAWSTGTRLSVPLDGLSPIGWLRRLAFLREPVDPRGILIAAGVGWGLVAVVALSRLRKPGVRKTAALAASLVLLAPALHVSPRIPEVVVRPVLTPVVRSGARIPLSITAKGDGGAEVEVRFRSESVRLPADGQPRLVLVVLAPGESEVEVGTGERFRVPLPVRWAHPGKPLVGALGAAEFVESVATAVSNAEVASIDLLAVPPAAGALEQLDAIVVPAADWDALPAARKSQLESYVALGGSCVVVGGGVESAPESRARPGVSRVPSTSDLGSIAFGRPPELVPNAFDATLKSLFARPDWQALDLTKLLLFMLAYHFAFLLAFLLPLALDSHKAASVYLVSVGTVMVVVVGAAWWSLRQFFLRDNQVYTQSLTYMAVPEGGGTAVLRQFRCYASMSGERRDVPWEEARDLLFYRDGGGRDRTLRLGGSRRLDGVWLDRFQSKLLVREDIVERTPLELVPEGDGFRLRRVAGAPDSAGLQLCTVTAAAIVGPDRKVQAATVEGSRIVPGGAGSEAFDAFVRALVGRFRGNPAGARRLVILRASGARRLDDVTGFFHVQDLEAVLAFDL